MQGSISIPEGSDRVRSRRDRAGPRRGLERVSVLREFFDLAGPHLRSPRPRGGVDQLEAVGEFNRAHGEASV